MRCVPAFSGVPAIDLSQLPSGFVKEVLSPNTKDVWPSDTSSLLDHDAIVGTLRAKYGCTCGQYVCSFLSLRTWLALESACMDISSVLNSGGHITEVRP